MHVCVQGVFEALVRCLVSVAAERWQKHQQVAQRCGNHTLDTKYMQSQERRAVEKQGLRVRRLSGRSGPNALQPHHWDRFYEFYLNTVVRLAPFCIPGNLGAYVSCLAPAVFEDYAEHTHVHTITHVIVPQTHRTSAGAAPT